MSSDFGVYVHKLPAGVLRPGSPRDVQALIRYCAANDIGLAVRGTGGSAYGQSLVSGGVVVDSSSMNRIRWVGEDMIDAECGATWANIADHCLSKDMIPPVLPDTLSITAGGTLSAAGIGETSYREGAQVDNVVELDVVTGRGDLVTCSPRQNRQLFEMTLAGMGSVGVLVRARLRLEPAPSAVVTRRYRYQSQDRQLYLDDLMMIAEAEKFGAVSGTLLRESGDSWSFLIEVTNWAASQEAPAWEKGLRGVVEGAPASRKFREYVHRLSVGLEDTLPRRNSAQPHPYISFFMPTGETGHVIEYIIEKSDVALGAKTIRVFPEINANFRQKLHKMPSSPHSFHVRIYRIASAEGAPDHLRMLQLNTEEVLPMILARGGKVYPPHTPLLSEEQKIKHYGAETWSELLAARKKYDPNGIFSNGRNV